MFRAPLRRSIASALVRAQTISNQRTFQAPAQTLVQQQRARIHEKTSGQQQPQTQSKETRKNPQGASPNQAEPSKTQSKQKKDAKGEANKPMNHGKDDLDDIKHILLVQAIADLIHDITHDFHD